jgi:hypothetical protein
MWTERTRPPAPTDQSPAWHPERDGLQRWWNGTEWADAWVADDGTIDVARGIGQKILKAFIAGGLDQPIHTRLLALLDGYPPAKIIQMSVYQGSLGLPTTNAVAVVEWQGPSTTSHRG